MKIEIHATPQEIAAIALAVKHGDVKIPMDIHIGASVLSEAVLNAQEAHR